MKHTWFRRVLISVLAVNLGDLELTWAQVPNSQQVLVEKIQRRLTQSKLKDERIIVKIDGDAVILEGKTSVAQHKGVATRLAHRAGAKNVVNRIQIVSAAPSPSAPMRRAVVKHVK